MVRTKADNCARKAVAAKAPRKSLPSSSPAASTSSIASPSSAKAGKYAGGNSVVVRPKPDWQKGIGDFLKKSPGKSDKENDETLATDLVETESEPLSEQQQSSSQASASSAEGSAGCSSSSLQRNGMIDSDDE